MSPDRAPGGSLKRTLGSPALFGIVQGFVAASIYFSLGLVAEHAGGWTWLVFAAAAVFFLLGVLAYVEGASLHQERGGATVLARYAFNELWSFVAGWAILLDYLILIAIGALVATSYAGELWGELDDGAVRFALAAGIVVAVALINARGATPRRYERAALVILADLLLQVTVVVLGIALIFEPDVLSSPTSFGGGETPSVTDVLFAFTLAAAAFTGLDASSGFAGEVAIGRRGLRRLVAARTLAAFLPYIGVSLVAASVLPLGDVSGREVEAPMIAVAAAFEHAWLRDTLKILFAVSGTVVLVTACNAAMLGLARLGYSLALNRQIPSMIGRLDRRYSTPVVVIGIGTVIAIALLLPLDLEFLAGIYAFGAMLAFTLVHASVLASRYREPDRDRPFRAPLNFRLGRASVPLPVVLGFVMSLLAFLSVLVTHGGARIAGVGWMAFGLVLYVGYRKSESKPIFKRVTIPQQALARERTEAAYKSILVPVFGGALDDDIVQTAGRLAREEERGDASRVGCAIDALWVHEVPMALPLGVNWPKAVTDRADRALARAKAVGEEYAGVNVATHKLPARKAGEVIVAAAREYGSQAIVLAAENPSRTRGGVLLGGRDGGRDFLGDATRYVVDKAPCRVIFTAPPSDDR